MLHLTFQLIVFFMGIYSVHKAVQHMVFFWGIKEDVGKSMIFFMVEQIVSATGTLLFSFGSLVTSFSASGFLEYISINSETATCIRMIMFGAMIHSTEHLSMSIRNIVSNNKS